MISFEMLKPNNEIPKASHVFLEPWQQDILSILEDVGLECCVIRYERDK